MSRSSTAIVLAEKSDKICGVTKQHTTSIKYKINSRKLYSEAHKINTSASAASLSRFSKSLDKVQTNNDWILRLSDILPAPDILELYNKEQVVPAYPYQIIDIFLWNSKDILSAGSEREIICP